MAIERSAPTGVLGRVGTLDGDPIPGRACMRALTDSVAPLLCLSVDARRFSKCTLGLLSSPIRQGRAAVHVIMHAVPPPRAI